MMLNVKGLGVIVVAVVAAGYLATQTADAASDSPPELPDWVNPDGTVDRAAAPERVPVAGPDGQLARDAQGRPITVPFEAPLPPPPRSAKAPGSIDLPDSTLRSANGGRIEVYEETIPPPRADGGPFPLAGASSTGP